MGLDRTSFFAITWSSAHSSLDYISEVDKSRAVCILDHRARRVLRASRNV